MPEPAAPEVTEAQAGTRRPVRTVQLEPRDRAARRAEWEAVSAEPRAAACARATPTACSTSTLVAAVFVSPRRIPFRRRLRAAHSAGRRRRACASTDTAAKGASPRARAVMCPGMAAVATSCAAGSARLSERAATVLAAPRPSRSGDCPCARSRREAAISVPVSHAFVSSTARATGHPCLPPGVQSEAGVAPACSAANVEPFRSARANAMIL